MSLFLKNRSFSLLLYISNLQSIQLGTNKQKIREKKTSLSLKTSSLESAAQKTDGQ